MLRATGFDALTVSDQAMSRESDDDLVKVYQKEKRTLITADLDHCFLKGLDDRRHFDGFGPCTEYYEDAHKYCLLDFTLGDASLP